MDNIAALTCKHSLSGSLVVNGIGNFMFIEFTVITLHTS